MSFDRSILLYRSRFKITIIFLQYYIVLFSIYQVYGAAENDRRDLGNLALMLSVQTGKNALQYYNNYGRYCGYGGAGEPIDSVDTCCMHHDHCYSDLMVLVECKDAGIEFYYWKNYIWEVTDEGNVSCVLFENGLYNFCTYALCECDYNLSICLQSASYDPNNLRSLSWRIFENNVKTYFDKILNFFHF